MPAAAVRLALAGFAPERPKPRVSSKHKQGENNATKLVVDVGERVMQLVFFIYTWHCIVLTGVGRGARTERKGG